MQYVHDVGAIMIFHGQQMGSAASSFLKNNYINVKMNLNKEIIHTLFSYTYTLHNSNNFKGITLEIITCDLTTFLTQTEMYHERRNEIIVIAVKGCISSPK